LRPVLIPEKPNDLAAIFCTGPLAFLLGKDDGPSADITVADEVVYAAMDGMGG